MKFLHFILFFLVASCQTTPNETVKNQTVNCENLGFIDSRKLKREILAIDSLKLNGNLPIISTISAYIEKLGKPVTTYIVTDEDVPLYGKNDHHKERYIFENIIVDRWGNEAIASLIDFRGSNIQVIHPKIILEEGTPIGEICKLFPASCKTLPPNGNQWSGYVELRASSGVLDFRRVFLIFQGEKLIKLRIINFDIR